MSEPQYYHAGEKEDVEFQRLSIQARVYDPVTFRLMEAAGVAEDWKCLEVGAGAGSIVQWLSSRVGSKGQVVATDVDLKFLRRLSAPNLEIRQHNILDDTLETSHYDLAHCRMVLMHLSDPEKALRKMADSLRPGGWLIIEDIDCGSLLSAEVTNPSAAHYATTLRALADFLSKRRIADLYFGRRLRSLVESLGYEDVGHEGFTYVLHGSDPMADMYATSFMAAASPMIAAKLLAWEDADKVYQLFLDPGFSYPGRTLFSAWCRKPS
ncbi:MAG: methyltransferase domain-containing protein [Candidatus Bathyarchaeota archaeon]|nr:methyltransferase domain-containing protein [Candidatus Bathyarchaeota archaeon]